MKNPFRNARFPGAEKPLSRKAHFREMSEAILRCTPGSAVERSLVAYLFDLRSRKQGECGRVWPSVRTMCERTGASRAQVFRALAALEDRGEILTLRRTQPLSRLDYSSATRIIGMRNVLEYERTYLEQGGLMHETGGVSSARPNPPKEILYLLNNRPAIVELGSTRLARLEQELKAFGLRDVDVIRRQGITLDHAEKCLKAARAVQHIGPGLLHKWLTGRYSPPALDVKSPVYDYVEAMREHERDNGGYSAPFDQPDGTVGQFARVASHGQSYRFRKRPPQAKLPL